MVIAQEHKSSSWSFADLTPAQTQYLTHGYHRYPAKFIPQLVRQLIEHYSATRDRICDPFGGCGTTLVEAKLNNRLSVGFDINPVAVFITRAKITAINPHKLSQSFAVLLHHLESKPGVPAAESASNHLDMERLRYWFGEDNLQRLFLIKHCVDQEEDPAVRRFFLCALSHVLKNCSYWLATSTKPQKDRDKIPENPLDAFITHASRMIERNGLFFDHVQRLRPSEPVSIMRKADARALPLPNDCIDLVITSPPYSTSYEYPDIHQLPALLFGFCRSLKDFRRGFIGSKNGSEHYRYQDEELCNRKAREAVRNLGLIDRRLGKAIHAYFLDMERVYREIYRVVRKGGRACVVIGDTELRGITLPNTEVAIDQMCRSGFLLEQVIERPVSGRVLAPYRDRHSGRFTSPENPSAKKVYSHEHILVMKK